jgi:dTDP-4-amino-4,6-dideoxygalactose transaminase
MEPRLQQQLTAAAEEILSLPMFPHLRDEQVTRVCEAVLEALAGEEARLA